MQNIYSVCEFGDVHDSIDAVLIANPDLPHARPDCIHRLPVIGVKTLLDLEELEACFAPGVRWEVLQAAAGTAAKLDRSDGSKHESVYKILHSRASG